MVGADSDQLWDEERSDPSAGRSSHRPRRAELGQRLLEDGLAGFRVAPVPHVGQVGLDRSDAARGRRVGLVAAGCKAAVRAIPGQRNLGGEREPG